MAKTVAVHLTADEISLLIDAMHDVVRYWEKFASADPDNSLYAHFVASFKTIGRKMEEAVTPAEDD